MAADHNQFANLIWQVADLLRGPYSRSYAAPWTRRPATATP
jgi:hypothetical protein